MRMRATPEGIDWLRLSEEDSELVGRHVMAAATAGADEHPGWCADHYVTRDGRTVCITEALRYLTWAGRKYSSYLDAPPADRAEVYEALGRATSARRRPKES